MPLFTSNSEWPKPLWEAELRFLRRYGWALSAVLFSSGLLLVNGLWSWILADTSWLPDTFMAWFRFEAILLSGLLALLPWTWWAAIVLERRLYRWLKHVPLSALLAVLLLATIDQAFRFHGVQEYFWQAVRARAGDNWFTREVALFRMSDNAQKREQDDRPSVVVTGSSQMLHAFDAALFEKVTGMRVHRRALAGFFLMENLAAIDFMPKQADVFLTMRSGFDLYARARIMPEAIKPVATADGLRMLFALRHVPMIVEEWKTWVDLWSSTLSSLWRDREYARLLLRQFLPATSPESALARQSGEAPAQENPSDVHDAELNQRDEQLNYKKAVLKTLMQRVGERYPLTIIIEGQINPQAPFYSQVAELDEDVRALMQSWSNGRDRVWVERERQSFILEQQDWHDNTHVKPDLRDGITRDMARLVLEYISDRSVNH